MQCVGGTPLHSDSGCPPAIRALPSAERGKEMLEMQMAPTTWALLGIEPNLVPDAPMEKWCQDTRAPPRTDDFSP